MRTVISIENLILIFSYYRDGERRGAKFLELLIRKEKDPEARQMLAEQLADESRHAELWGKRIRDLGGEPVDVEDGYQARMREEVGIPKTLAQLYALIIELEDGAQERYRAHARWPIDSETREILTIILEDEEGHLWMKEKLNELAGSKDNANALLERYRQAGQRVMGGLQSKERERIGFSFSDNPDSS